MPDTVENKLAQLTKLRGILRTRVTKLVSKVNSNIASYDAQLRNLNLQKLQSMQVELRQMDRDILPLYLENNLSGEQIEAHNDEEEEYQDKLLLAMSSLQSAPTAEQQSGIAAGPGPSTTPQSFQKSNLPKVPLPEFCNFQNEDVKKFLRAFEFVISKYNLSSYEKFLYLKSQLSGSPQPLIDSIDVDQQSFEVARDLLEKAFDSTQHAKHNAIKLLSNLKLDFKTDPYSFIGQMRTMKSNFDSLSISVPDIQQFFVWNALNSKFQTHVTNITNKTSPSLTEIEECIFEATDRYIREQKLLDRKEKPKEPQSFQTLSPKLEKGSSNMAVHISGSSKGKFCPLCAKDKKPKDHELRNCRVYDNPNKKLIN